ncbi:MAG: hypothetical protein FD122_2681 [Stygiobacter sp.]|nr:MAG: hypothetical protein FD122_2681 [Stygiobacter sp.]KAF0215216.1 MAG: hypothetical protein FD178_1855 [Ignavibacteria bacterium]
MSKEIDVDKINSHIHKTTMDILNQSKDHLEKSISLLESSEPDRYSKCATQLKDVAKILNAVSKELATPRISSPKELKSIVDYLCETFHKN